jgi:hypothetical protein
MLKLITRSQKAIHLGMTFALGATLLWAASAGATNTYPETQTTPKDDYSYCSEFKQVYADTEYSKNAHQHLDVLCDEGYRAISCEADIAGQNSYHYDKYYVSLNELTPQGFKQNSHGDYVHASSDATYWGCHIRANNNLLYFTPSHHPQYGYDFSWKIVGFATCVPKDCVEVYETHNYYDEYVDPIDY